MKVKDILLCTKDNIEYWVKALSKEQYDELKVDIHNAKITKSTDEFKQKHKLDLSMLSAIGDVKVSENFISQYIPHHYLHKFDKTTPLIKSSLCYGIKNHDYKVNVLHYDCLSSWNCVLQILNNPKFVIIYMK